MEDTRKEMFQVAKQMMKIKESLIHREENGQTQNS
jgi:hypothetical protein